MFIRTQDNNTIGHRALLVANKKDEEEIKSIIILGYYMGKKVLGELSDSKRGSVTGEISSLLVITGKWRRLETTATQPYSANANLLFFITGLCVFKGFSRS